MGRFQRIQKEASGTKWVDELEVLKIRPTMSMALFDYLMDTFIKKFLINKLTITEFAVIELKHDK